MGRLEGKVAVVLGASRRRNMGQAIAERFLEEGAKVIVAGRSADGLREFAHRTGCQWHACDVRSKADIQALADFAMATHGTINIGVNGAATGRLTQFESVAEEELDEMLGVIFKGSFFFLQVMVGVMKRGGSLINISSAVADIMFDSQAPYQGAKAGMNQVTRAVANEYGAKGIRANIIAPGFTVSPMIGDHVVPGMIDAFVKEYPLGRLNTVDDVAEVALFVASDACFMTGETFNVTGGLRLRRNPTPAEIGAAIAAAATAAG